MSIVRGDRISYDIILVDYLRLRVLNFYFIVKTRKSIVHKYPSPHSWLKMPHVANIPLKLQKNVAHIFCILRDQL